MLLFQQAASKTQGLKIFSPCVFFRGFEFSINKETALQRAVSLFMGTLFFGLKYGSLRPGLLR